MQSAHIQKIYQNLLYFYYLLNRKIETNLVSFVNIIRRFVCSAYCFALSFPKSRLQGIRTSTIESKYHSTVGASFHSVVSYLSILLLLDYVMQKNEKK